MTKRRNPLLTFLILFITIYVVGCASPRISESPLSPLSPLASPASGTRSAPITPTPTSTLTPGPTQTPQPTSTWTPVPTPTPPPNPSFPSEAMIPEKLPSLPANLYFIRNGSLWRWPEEGQNLQQVVIGPQQSRSTGGKLARPVSGAPPAGVRAYRLSPDERFLIYTFGVVSPETFEPEMIVLDQVTGESYPISTARNFETTSLNKPSFDIIPDGRYAIYTAWNVKPTTSSSQGAEIVEVSNAPGGVKYGTIFAVDVTNINREGVWLSDVPEGNPRLIAEHQHHNNFCGIWHVRDWAPDGKHLLIDVGCYEGGYSGIMDVTTGEVQKIPHTRNYPGPYVNITWRRNGTDLLVSSINLVTGVGPVCLAQIPTAAPTQESVIISTTWPSEVWPTEPHDLPDGRIGFAHQPCVDGPGMQPGIYTIARDGTGLEFVSPLPASPCYISEIMHKKGMVHR